MLNIRHLHLQLQPARALYQTRINSWVAGAGNYTVKIGTSQNVNLSGSFKREKDIMVEMTNNGLVPKTVLSELVSKPARKK